MRWPPRGSRAGTVGRRRRDALAVGARGRGGHRRRPVRRRGRPAVAGDGVLASRAPPASVVLLGDPNQLPQVSQGIHPEGAGASALEHLVGEAKTIAARSRAAARDDVPPPPGRQRLHLGRVLRGPARDRPRATRASASGDGEPVGGTGIRFVPLPHPGPATAPAKRRPGSRRRSRRCVGRRWVDRKGRRAPARGRRTSSWSRRTTRRSRRSPASVERRLGARRQRRHRRQVPGPRGAGRDLFDDDVDARGGAARIRSSCTRATASTSRVSRARGLAVVVANPAAAPRRVPHARADAAGERVLPAGGGRRRAAGGRAGARRRGARSSGRGRGGDGRAGALATLASSAAQRGTDPPPGLVLFPELDTRPSRR